MVARGEKEEPRLVFLDTEVFVQQNFQYEKGLLDAFRQHVYAGRLRHVTTDITLDEVRARIGVAVDGARVALRRFQSDARVLRNSSSPSVLRMFKSVNRRRVLRDLRSQLEVYLDDIETVRVTSDDVKASAIFARYFTAKPPFDNPRKKSEFPDAFAMEALRMFAEKADQRVIVVTGDPDWTSFAEEQPNLEHVPRLDELLRLLQEDSPLFASADQAITTLTSEIEKRLAQKCLALGFFVVDRPATVTGVQMAYVHLHNTYVVNVTDDGIIFSSDASVNFNVLVEYPTRPDVGESRPWDLTHRPRRRYSKDFDEPSLHAYESFRIIGSVTWKAPAPESAELIDLDLSDARAVPVYCDEYES